MKLAALLKVNGNSEAQLGLENGKLCLKMGNSDFISWKKNLTSSDTLMPPDI